MRTIKRVFTDWLTVDSPADNQLPFFDYGAFQREIKPGDVVLVEGRSRVSQVIKALTNSAWSHSALYIGRLHDIEDVALRKVVARLVSRQSRQQLLVESILGQGIILTPLDYYKKDHLRICRPRGLTQPDAEQIVGYAIKSLGKPYSMRHILDLARFLLPWSVMPRRWGSVIFAPGGRMDAEICSKVIADAFKSVNFPILPEITNGGEKPSSQVFMQRNSMLFLPRDFDYSPYFDVIKYPILGGDSEFYKHLPWSHIKGRETDG